MEDALTELELSLVRFRAYRHFARLFAPPEHALHETILAEAFPVASGIRALLSASGTDESGASDALARAIARSGFETLEREHARAFGPIIGKDCPPYETQFGTSMVFQQAQRLADVSGFYRAFGLKPAAAAAERLDHVSLELEFMAFLAARDIASLGRREKKETEAALVRAKAASDFLREHLLPWVPLFAERLAARVETGVLRSAGTALTEFLIADARLRGIDPESVERFDLLPVSSEPEGNCFSCSQGGGDSAEKNLGDVPM
jgi:TorA maturation chaperone TorD